MKNVLIINAHQRWKNYAEGKLNQSFLSVAQERLIGLGYNVQTTVIDKEYDVDNEIEKHQWAEVVIVQTPMFWMSVPWLFKKYIDEVFTAGLGGKLAHHDGRVIDDPSHRYGSGGVVKGKKFMLSATLNAPEYAFNAGEFFEGKGIDGLFMWLHKIYQFNGFDSLPGFAAYDVIKNPTIEQDLVNFDRHISQHFALNCTHS